jgi:serine phosphatase RsbU (regulator of sigma subunit)/anti-sigma regulatory factor (Ser/Thr protein kinase)
MSEPIPVERGLSQRVVFRCDFAAARTANGILRAFLEEQGLDESELFNLELCLAEACNNAVQHAGQAGTHALISAEAVCHTSAVELRVTDHTPGFELKTKQSTLSPHLENGRGLFIIQSLMDEVHYLRGADRNTLFMRKSRTHQQHRSTDDSKVASMEAARRQLETCQQTIGGMARELCFRSESLSAIFRCCSELGRTSDLDGFANRLLTDLLHLASADWFVLRLLSVAESQLISFVVFPLAMRGESLDLSGGSDGALSTELLAAITRREMHFDAGRAGAALDPLCAGGPQSTGLVHPLLFNDQLVGTLALGRRMGDAPFSLLQAEMIRTFSEFLTVQVVNARHLEEQVHARLVAHELDIAHRIQRALLPRTLPQFAGFRLAASWESARQVGGDFYDAIPLNAHAVLLVVADVMGKGVPAAMFATIMRSLLRAMAWRSHHPAKLLRRLNELLYEELSTVGMFITAQLVYVDLKRRHLVAASAGHCPILIIGADTVRTLRATGTPLGILPNTKYRQQSTTFGEPGGVVLYTDGVTESVNPAGDMYTHDRLAEWLRQSSAVPRTAEQLREELAAELSRFRGGAPLRDDQAFLILAEDTSQPAGAGYEPASSRKDLELVPEPHALL